MKFHDLVLLLDNRSERYDEVACFARHLDQKDVAACVSASHTMRREADRTTFGFAYGNVWRFLRIEEKIGIAVLSCADDPKGPSELPLGTVRVADPDTLWLLQSLHRAASVPVDELVPYAVRQEHFALLRKRDGILHRNLLMEWREIAGAPPSSSGKWMTVDCSKHSGNPFFGWVKQSLWADVPKPDLSKCKMDLGLRYPFPGADAHPDKRGGELCVEGTCVPVAEILVQIASKWERIAGLDLASEPVERCLRGLADWLKTQTWVDRHVQCEGCARRRTYKCAPPFDGSACPDRSVARNRYDDGPGDVTSEDCAKLEGISREAYFDMAWVQREIDRGYRHGQRELAKMVAASISAPEGGFRCKRCGLVFLASAKDKEGRPCVRGGHAVCPECACAWPVDDAPPVEKRCGTCALSSKPEDCAWIQSTTRPDGPPWPDCRFWKEKP